MSRMSNAADTSKTSGEELYLKKNCKHTPHNLFIFLFDLNDVTNLSLSILS